MISINAAVISCALCLLFGGLLGVLWACCTTLPPPTRDEPPTRKIG